jgi:hypothetical protein
MDSGKSKVDRLDLAAYFLKGLLLFCVAVLIFIIVESAVRTPEEESRAAALFHALGLSVPALIPSGREARNPDGMDRRVDLRISPFFPLPDPDAAGLIIRGTVQGTRRTAPE